MAGSTFLSLTNRVLRHFNEVVLTSTTFPTATGFQLTVQDYVNEAVRELQQSEYEWPFNYNKSNQIMTLYTVGGFTAPNVYALPATYESVDWESFVLKPDTTLTNPVTAQHVPYKDYDEYRQIYEKQDLDQMAQYNANNANIIGIQPPQFVFRAQNDKFGIFPISDQAYNVDFEWWGYPAELNLNTDTTTVPSRFDHVIFKGAVAYGYMFRGDQASYQMWRKLYEDGINKMRELLINRYKNVRDARVRRAG